MITNEKIKANVVQSVTFSIPAVLKRPFGNSSTVPETLSEETLPGYVRFGAERANMFQ